MSKRPNKDYKPAFPSRPLKMRRTHSESSFFRSGATDEKISIDEAELHRKEKDILFKTAKLMIETYFGIAQEREKSYTRENIERAGEASVEAAGEVAVSEVKSTLTGYITHQYGIVGAISSSVIIYGIKKVYESAHYDENITQAKLALITAVADSVCKIIKKENLADLGKISDYKLEVTNKLENFRHYKINPTEYPELEEKINSTNLKTVKETKTWRHEYDKCIKSGKHAFGFIFDQIERLNKAMKDNPAGISERVDFILFLIEKLALLIVKNINLKSRNLNIHLKEIFDLVYNPSKNPIKTVHSKVEMDSHATGLIEKIKAISHFITNSSAHITGGQPQTTKRFIFRELNKFIDEYKNINGLNEQPQGESAVSMNPGSL